MFKLPTLYKQTETGAIQEWTVEVEPRLMLETFEAGLIRTTYGQSGGKMQVTEDVVTKGKNLGKKNATTPYEQAELEAKQHWDKKKKKGYTEDLKLAQSTDNVLSAIKPMLALVYQDYQDKVPWPALVQPKLDGMRCVAIVKDGVCTLWSRSQKPILTVPHIVKAVEKLAGGEDRIFDGELYNHDLKDDFNRIMSLAKRGDVHPDHELIQYHVYDLPSSSDDAAERSVELLDLFIQNYPGYSKPGSHLAWVPTLTVHSDEEMMERLTDAMSDGYEGLMYRNPSSPYEGKRSKGLLKVKALYDETLVRDEEFTAVRVKEGRGKLRGKAGAIWCVTKEGKEFKAPMNGKIETLADYLVNFEKKYKGKPLTVRFQNYTPAGVPRFPKGLRFREEE